MSTMYIGKYSDSGSKNAFYKMSRGKYGFKSFPNKSLAEFAHTIQSDLAFQNYAPRVYSPVCKIRVPEYFATGDGKGGIKSVEQLVLSDWGYLTEIAKPFYCYKCEEYCYDNPNCRKYKTVTNLTNDLYDIFGIEYIDAHNGNLGYVTRNKRKVLVVIDVGRESIGDIGSYDEPEWDSEYNDSAPCSCSECNRA